MVAIITLIVPFIQMGKLRLETGEATHSNSQSVRAWTLSPRLCLAACDSKMTIVALTKEWVFNPDNHKSTGRHSRAGTSSSMVSLGS